MDQARTRKIAMPTSAKKPQFHSMPGSEFSTPPHQFSCHLALPSQQATLGQMPAWAIPDTWTWSHVNSFRDLGTNGKESSIRPIVVGGRSCSASEAGSLKWLLDKIEEDVERL
jgi:hypothetical protein